MALGIDDLEKLCKMKKAGLLSEAEFEKLKQSALNEVPKVETPKKNITFGRIVAYIFLAIFIGIPVLTGVITGYNEANEKHKGNQGTNIQSKVQKRVSKDQTPTITNDDKIIYASTNNEIGTFIKKTDYDYKDKVEFLACDTQENFEKYMSTMDGETDVNYIEPLISSGKCTYLTNVWKTPYRIKVKKTNLQGTRTNIVEVIGHPDVRDYYVDIFLSKSILVIKDKEDIRIEKQIKEFKNKEKVVKLEAPFIVCIDTYYYEKSFFSDWSSGTTKNLMDEGMCVKLAKGTSLQKEEIDKNLYVKYKVLDGKYAGRFFFGINYNN